VGFAAGLCAGALAGWLAGAGGRGPAPAAPQVRVVPTFEAARADEAAAALGAPEAAARAAQPDPAEPAATQTGLPRAEKLVAISRSREPHEVLAAWDEDAASASPGERRAFVLLVSPAQSDASLEALARDVRDENEDARLLDVRVYDDADAARSPRVADAGQRARAHLVAEVQRNEAAGLDVIQVRGRRVLP